MKSITLRNISDRTMERIKVLSMTEKRSLNNEILVLLEKGIEKEVRSFPKDGPKPSQEAQVGLWEDLCGRWEDTRTTGDIIKDIVSGRTMGREFDL